MALNSFEMWSNGITIAFFSKNYNNLRYGFASRPPFELNYFTRRVFQFRRFHFLTICLSLLPLAIFWLVPNQATTSEFLFYDIFVQQKNLDSKIYDDVIVCDLWFAPLSNQKSWLRLCCIGSISYPPITF